MNEKDNELSLQTTENELAKKLMEENDPAQLKRIVDLFNINMKKKDIIRTSKLNQLQDQTVAQIEKRISQQPDLFSNKDLLDYYKVIQDTINRGVSFTSENIPNIQFNQQVININDSSSELSKESKEKVLDFIKMIQESNLNENIHENDSENIIDAIINSKEEK